MKGKKKNTQRTYSEQLSDLKNHDRTTGEPSPASRWMGNLMPYGIAAVVLLLLGTLLYLQEWEMLYRSQELSLFLPTRQFYEGMTIYQGGPLQWLACWATQFF